MALARGILVWLPLERLLRLIPQPSEALINERVAEVNQVPEEVVRNLASRLQLPWGTRHIWLSVFQGELSDFASDFVDIDACCFRALTLGDSATYINLCERRSPMSDNSVSSLEAQLVFQSGKLEIVAAYLAALRELRLDLVDLRSVNWTPELRRMTISYLRTISWRDDHYIAVLAGYLQLEPLSETILATMPDPLAYITGLAQGRDSWSLEEWEIIRRRVAGRTFGRTMREFLTELGIPPREEERGDLNLVQIALDNLQPDVLATLPDQIRTVYNADLSIPKLISNDFLARAQAMLNLIRDRQLSVPVEYTRDLHIFLGQSFQETSPSLENWEKEELRRVCHPQLRPEHFSDMSTPDHSDSIVYYDMHNYIACHPGTFSRDAHAPRLLAIYMQGCYLRALLAGKIDYEKPAPMILPRLKVPFQQIYSELLAVAGGQTVVRTKFPEPGSRREFQVKGAWTGAGTL